MTSKTTSNSPTPGETTGADVAPVTPEIPAVVNASEPVVAPVPAATRPHTAPAATPPPTPAVSVPEALFTQADLDRILAERLQRERAKFAGFDDLQAQVQDLAGKLQAQEAAATQASNRAAQAERERQIVTAAAALGFADPADAVRLLDATVKPEAIESELKGLATKKPYLVRRQAQPVAPANPARSTEPARPTEAERLASYLGRTPGAFWAGGGYTLSPKGLEE